MDLILKDRVVLIADNESESAEAFIHAFRREGAYIALCLGESQPEPAGADAVYRCDLSDFEKANLLRQKLNDRFGRLDALVFKQYAVERTSVLTQSAYGFTERLGEARAAFVCCKVFAEYMVSQGSGGSALFVTTLHDEKPNGSDFAHSVAQGMLQNLVMEAALEYGPKGLRVNQVALGAMEGYPERFESKLTTFYDGCIHKTPLGKLGTARDVAEAALFLASPCSSFLSGARLRMDGGMSLHYVDPMANNRALASRKETGR